jgi:AcrR family transcriptional regulator
VPLQLTTVDDEPRERADAQRNRSKVLCAAATLFAEHGVENVSMDAIAAAAGVGKGTLFRRFGDRAGLARALLHERTRRMQEEIIRGPAPLGPGAAPQVRLRALARAQLTLLDDHADLIAAGESGPPGARLRTAPYEFLRLHVSVLVREADPECDWELLTEMLLAPFGGGAFLYWRRQRGFSVERIHAAYETLVDRVLPS